MRLLLFDIDGTLLHTNQLNKNIFCQALSEAFDLPIIWQGYPGTQYTDTAMALNLVRASGFVGDPAVPLARAFSLMADIWATHRETAPIHIYPGVATLLNQLAARDDLLLGIVTANGRSGAWGKINAARFDHIPFLVGAYGDEAAHRNALPPIALQRASAHLGRPITGADTIVIGDTPADIACARAINAQVLAVATGRYPPADLAQHNPDFLLETLEDTPQVVDILTRTVIK